MAQTSADRFDPDLCDRLAIRLAIACRLQSKIRQRDRLTNVTLQFHC